MILHITLGLIFGIYRFLIDFTILTSPIKSNQRPNPSPTPQNSWTGQIFWIWKQIHGPWILAGIVGSPTHAGQHVRNNRALAGLGSREGMWQKGSLRDPCGWIWLLSLEMLLTEADTPSGCSEPGYQTTLTCATWLSLLLPARGSHGQFAKHGGDRKQRWH